MTNLVAFCVHKGIEQPAEWSLSIRHHCRLGGGLSKKCGHSTFASAVWKLFFGILGAVCGDVIVGNRSHHLFLCGGVVEKNADLFTTHQETF